MRRPIYHFTPQRFWMNDPNGLVFLDGEYHLFYQYNPSASEWGQLGWGHAISTDFVNWAHLPQALSATDRSMAFSGSAVVDTENASGLSEDERPPLVLIYTSHSTGGQTPLQAQHIAFSVDRGRSWQDFEHNPVLDIGSDNFRDPKVFWHEDSGRWVMVVVVANDHVVQIYASHDLLSWKYLSSFGPSGSTLGEWECPDLFALSVDDDPERRKWILKVDTTLGGVSGGSGGQYFVGDFDGVGFQADAAMGQSTPVDYGRDFYAAMSWSNLPAGRRPIWLGWMSNWQYAADTPTHPWRGVQSSPRSLRLVTLGNATRLAQEPIEELANLRSFHRRVTGIELVKGENLSLDDSSREALELDIRLGVVPDTIVAVRLSRSSGAYTTIRFDCSAEELSTDRRHSAANAFHPDFPGRHSGPLQAVDGGVRIRILLDHCCLEVFGGQGETVITDLIFPDGGPGSVVIACEQGATVIETLDLWHLDATSANGAARSSI